MPSVPGPRPAGCQAGADTADPDRQAAGGGPAGRLAPSEFKSRDRLEGKPRQGMISPQNFRVVFWRLGKQLEAVARPIPQPNVAGMSGPEPPLPRRATVTATTPDPV